jgi:hypothetical protein
MKVYIIDYHNGEAYEDYNEWVSDVAYTSIEKCEEVLIDNGFKKDSEKWMGKEYWTQLRPYDHWENEHHAIIIELEVV